MTNNGIQQITDEQYIQAYDHWKILGRKLNQLGEKGLEYHLSLEDKQSSQILRDFMSLHSVQPWDWEILGGMRNLPLVRQAALLCNLCKEAWDGRNYIRIAIKNEDKIWIHEQEELGFSQECKAFEFWRQKEKELGIEFN